MKRKKYLILLLHENGSKIDHWITEEKPSTIEAAIKDNLFVYDTEVELNAAKKRRQQTHSNIS